MEKELEYPPPPVATHMYLFIMCGSLYVWVRLISVCLDYIKILTKDQCLQFEEVLTVHDNGTCYNDNGTLRALWNQSLAAEHGIQRTLPSQEYYE